MFDYPFSNYETRPTGALEIAVEARNREREMAILSLQYRDQKPTESKKRSSLLRTLIAGLFLS